MFYEVLGDEPVSATKKTATNQLMAAVEKKEIIIITSVITHLEVLPSKLDAKGAADAADYMDQFDGEKFAEVEISANILLRAREIRDFYYQPQTDASPGKMMDLGDAIHLATASLHKASEFHTRDKDKKGIKVPLLKLYEMSGNPKLCGKYELKIVSPEAAQGELDVRPKG